MHHAPGSGEDAAGVEAVLFAVALDLVDEDALERQRTELGALRRFQGAAHEAQVPAHHIGLVQRPALVGVAHVAPRLARRNPHLHVSIDRFR